VAEQVESIVNGHTNHTRRLPRCVASRLLRSGERWTPFPTLTAKSSSALPGGLSYAEIADVLSWIRDGESRLYNAHKKLEALLTQTKPQGNPRPSMPAFRVRREKEGHLSERHVVSLDLLAYLDNELDQADIHA